MSYPINPKINPYQQQMAMGMNSDSSGNNLPMGLNTPQIQDVNVDKIKQKSALKNIGDNESKESPGWLVPALILPVGIGMGKAMDVFNNACKGTYEESLLGRVNAFGEKVGQKAPFIDKIFEYVDKGINLLKKHVVSRSKILSAAFFTPSVPEHDGALMMANGTKSEVATHVIGEMNRYTKEGGKLLGTTPEEIEKLTKEAHNLPGIERIMEICSKQDKKLSFEAKNFWGIWFSKAITGKQRYLSDIPGFKKIFGSKMYFSEYANKLKALTKPEGKTLVGKKLSAAMIRVIEGITNGNAAGKGAIIFASWMIADAIKKTIEAPNKNGEKRKVFAESFISNIGWYLTMPISLMAMHYAGGLQYLGMGKGENAKANVAKYREKLKIFNADAQAGLLSDKKLYNARRQELIDILKGDTKLSLKEGTGKTLWKSITNIINKPLRAFGRTVTVGLERIRPYISKTQNPLGKLWNAVKIASYKSKWLAGWPMRFGLFMFVTAPFFGNWFARLSHVIFGRPSKSMLDKEGEHEKTTQHPQPVIAPQQAKSVIQPAQRNIASAPFERQNLLDMYKAKSANQAMMPINQDSNRAYMQASASPAMMPNYQEPARTYMPSSAAPSMMPTNNEPVRTYVPSEAGIVIHPSVVAQENAKANEAFLKADNAERKAMGHLD